jgi:hypothetical protein
LVYLSKKKGKVGIESYLLKTNPSKNYDAIFAITEDADYETNNPGVLEEFKYMNRTIAQCVCEIGLDGWIAMPENDVKQRVFNPQITIAVNTLISQINKLNEIKNKTEEIGKTIKDLEKTYSSIMNAPSEMTSIYVDYAPEIVICNPNVNIIQEESKRPGGSKTKKGGNKKRRKTRNKKQRK